LLFRSLIFTLPPTASSSMKKAILQACEISGIDTTNVSIKDSSESLVKTYGRKILGVREVERAGIEGKKSILIEMGHTQTTIVIVEVESSGPKILAVSSDLRLGALHFDMQLFDHFASICLKKSNTTVTPGSKRGARLLSSCERLRKLLSQLPEAQVTVENLTDSGDVSFSLRRDELSSLCAELLQRFRSLLLDTLVKAGLEASMISNVEVLGGGLRMQVVQAVITSVFGEGIPLGAKLDDVSIALGGALLALQTPPVPAADVAVDAAAATDSATAGPENADPKPMDVEGGAVTEPGPESEEEQGTPTPAEEVLALAEKEVASARERELAMRAQDEEVRALQGARNSMEAYILEMRGATKRKHGQLIDSAALNTVLDSHENWLWDCSEEASLSELTGKNNQLREEVQQACASFFKAVEEERLSVEMALESEAKKAEAERAAEGEDEDHDNRKLKKADRMRLVVKNKEEGNELFHGKNFRPAAARYHKALGHCAKFFDLTADDEKELKQLKLSLHLNLAQCYLNLENWDQAMRNCDDALGIDENNAKALFRRSAVWEAKKEYEMALTDLKSAEKLAADDKMISKAIDRIRKQIQKEKDKAKKTWGGAFAKA